MLGGHPGTFIALDIGTLLAVVGIGLTLWRVNKSSRDRLQDKIDDLTSRVITLEAKLK